VRSASQTSGVRFNTLLGIHQPINAISVETVNADQCESWWSVSRDIFGINDPHSHVRCIFRVERSETEPLAIGEAKRVFARTLRRSRPRVIVVGGRTDGTSNGLSGRRCEPDPRLSGRPRPPSAPGSGNSARLEYVHSASTTSKLFTHQRFPSISGCGTLMNISARPRARPFGHQRALLEIADAQLEGSSGQSTRPRWRVGTLKIDLAWVRRALSIQLAGV
jgi:hypothetical protein